MRWMLGLVVAAMMMAQAKAPKSAAAMFEPGKVWTVHLKFDAAQWEAMEPKGGMRGGPGMPGGLWAPAFLKALDENKDRVLTREELTSGFARLFDAWGGKAGVLSAEQLRAGVERDFAVPMPGPVMRPPLEE